MKVELGGGPRPRDGFINVDLCEGADVRHNLELPGPLPFDDNSVTEVYSSHCLEHVRNLAGLIREIARICAVGANVEIRVPHWGSSMAVCAGHVHTISEDQVRHWGEFAEDWFGNGKRLVLADTEYVRSMYFDEAKGLHPDWTDEQIFRFVPATCHEIRFRFVVEMPK